MRRSWLMVGFLLAGAAQAGDVPAVGTVKDGKVVKSARDEIARLQKELDEQRALLIRVLEVQEQQYAMLVKLAKGELSASQVSAIAQEPIEPAPRVVEPTAPIERPVKVAPRNPGKTAAPAVATGSVSGKVSFSSGSAPAWVYVEDLRGTASGELEIKQQDKQFSPRVVAVPRGTKLNFANYDSIFHNVFSTSPGNAFDLGNTRSGETPKSVPAMTPGVIEIFCNMHSKMSATVLVTPGTHLVRVEADGSFKLDDVPVGTHRIGAWAGGLKPTVKEVEVTTAGSEVSFDLQAGEGGPHKNKNGQSYGSYAD